MKEQGLYREAIKNFSQIKSTGKGLGAQNIKVKDNIIRKIINPCQRIAQAKNQVHNIRHDFDEFSSYLKQMRTQGKQMER